VVEGCSGFVVLGRRTLPAASSLVPASASDPGRGVVLTGIAPLCSSGRVWCGYRCARTRLGKGTIVSELSALGGVHAKVVTWWVAYVVMVSGRAAGRSGLTPVRAWSVGECGARGNGGVNGSASGFSVGEYGVLGDGGVSGSASGFSVGEYGV
jgi:hypothetical protein